MRTWLAAVAASMCLCVGTANAALINPTTFVDSEPLFEGAFFDTEGALLGPTTAAFGPLTLNQDDFGATNWTFNISLQGFFPSLGGFGPATNLGMNGRPVGMNLPTSGLMTNNEAIQGFGFPGPDGIAGGAITVSRPGEDPMGAILQYRYDASGDGAVVSFRFAKGDPDELAQLTLDGPFPIPEPQSMAMLGLGLTVLALSLRRRRRT